MLTFQALMERQLLVHSDRAIGRRICPPLAELLDARVGPESVTLETGAGLSTLVILRRQPRHHTAIHPVADEFAAILDLANEEGVDTRGLFPVLARSQDWLPHAELPELDLVLLNGAHPFPVPFIDWYYGAARLRVGGLMIVDDIRPTAGATLARFMQADPQWEEVTRGGAPPFAVYRKLGVRAGDPGWASPPVIGGAFRPEEAAALAEGTVTSALRRGTGTEPLPARLPVLPVVPIRSWEEYQEYCAAMADEHRRRDAVERSLIPFGAERFAVDGYCAVCDRPAHFEVSFAHSYRTDAEGRPLPNWREHLRCRCGFVNRMRAALHIIQQEIRPRPDARIYLTEQVTGLYAWLKSRYPDLIGSEYLGAQEERGAVCGGVRNEDLTALTFADQSFDLVLSFDVLEHVPDVDRALRECFRSLRPGGSLVFSAPFRPDSRTNVVRARLGADGTIEHLLPPEYHENPVNRERGALCFRDFGWQVLDQMRAVGFADPRALMYWSRELGYLGGDQILMVASRPAA